MIPSQVTADAKTELYGIFGNPVHHSLSPLIHNALFSKLKINAVYVAFQVETAALALAFEAVRSLGIRGVNLTIPFKEAALNYIDEIPEDIDRCVGALNTVVNKNGRLFGYNTDVLGFLIALKEELQFMPEGKKVLVLGAGGAARAVTSALARAHADRLWIHNRTESRAEGLKSYLSDYFPEIEIETLADIDALRNEKIDLVVNTTSCGMRQADKVLLDLRRLSGKAHVYDLIYAPSETPLLKQARQLGLVHANGLGMLAAQAALSFELWTGEKNAVRESMLEVLKKCSW